jgi:hypothetical protein
MPFKTGPNSGLGVAPLTGTPAGIPDTVAAVPVGTVVTMVDEIQGAGEFIYLPGVAGLVAGDAVVYDLNPASISVARYVQNTFANSGRPLAIALTALTAAQFGWYQISGVAIANVVAGTAAGVAMGTATTGQLGNTADAGDQILNARISTAVGTPAAGKAYLTLQRPFVQGQIT